MSKAVGIDMALYLVGLAKCPEAARGVQKAMEYYPEPPFADDTVGTSVKEEERWPRI